eukprot:CAMPEP_0183388010 /NCGR_PEP_ID=MMETSP0370-20130417/3755_1 /TAXON_ID=268820 /ORGANISM="Peridinium aciculiferum, Strain PAER-2" /LENGTH=152 /DNA_ID=CAMNT_0025566827 /DNA_START=93 /DNA_END=551 /DNA_ORIENTATION=-
MRSDPDARLPIPRVLPDHAVKNCVHHLLAVLVLGARDAASRPLERFAAFALEHRDEAREGALASVLGEGHLPEGLAELAQFSLSLAACLPGTSDAHGRLALAPAASQAVGAVDVPPLQPADALLHLNGRHRPVARPLLNLEGPIGGITQAKA